MVTFAHFPLFNLVASSSPSTRTIAARKEQYTDLQAGTKIHRWKDQAPKEQAAVDLWAAGAEDKQIENTFYCPRCLEMSVKNFDLHGRFK